MEYRLLTRDFGDAFCIRDAPSPRGIMIKKQITDAISARLSKMLAEWGVQSDTDIIQLELPPNPAMGDYALSMALRLARVAKMSPIKIAEGIADLLVTETKWFRSITVLPPGYVNLTLASDAIESALADASAGDLCLHREGEPQTVVVDYSGVNIAKQLHVGHLRSTIIGDAIARVLEARGEKVIRQNHLGDWGLPIAMVLWKAQPILRETERQGQDVHDAITLSGLEEIYRDAATACKEDPAAREECQQILVALQSGDQQLLADWHTITRISMDEVYRLYELLGVSLTEESERGESFYRDMLQDTVASLESCGVVVQDEGALCVFMDEFKTRDGSPLPVIVRKSDGGFNYETFDLAAIRFRIKQLRADRVIYVTDSRQSLHFEQVFAVADKCDWTVRNDERISLEHVAFGSVLGEDNKPLKTRSGENVKLADVIREAIDRAYAVVMEKNPALTENRKQEVAHMIGIGAIKYADLSHERIKDYVFSLDRMLALEGNTGPYLQYAHARICSIFRKGKIDEDTISGPPLIQHTAERALALKLLEFSEAVASVEADLRPHILCTYLYDLANTFTAFYDQCSVLNAQTTEQKESRLFLCRMVQRTLVTGLGLLGIQAPREM